MVLTYDVERIIILYIIERFLAFSKNLLGHNENEIVRIKFPAGALKYKILEITI